MRLETRACLHDLVRAGKLIQRAIANLTLEDFLLDWEKQSAVERQFMIIGEALVRIRNYEAGVYDLIPDSASIIGFRNVLVHGYDVADPEAVFDLAHTPLQELLTLVEQISLL